MKLSKPIYYLAHPYKEDPNKSFRKAQLWFFMLRQKGYNVFSPILHSHNYAKSLKNNFLVFEYPPPPKIAKNIMKIVRMIIEIRFCIIIYRLSMF